MPVRYARKAYLMLKSVCYAETTLAAIRRGEV